MDNKPLLQDRPPAYNAVPGAYEYGAIPAAAPPAAGFQPPAPPPPYQGFPVAAAGYPAAPGQSAAGYPAAPGQSAAGYPAAPGQSAAGYPAAPGQSAAGYPAAQGQTAYTSTYTIVQPSVVVVGGCPACRVGVLEDDFTCLGIMCAIFFFPLGILFCLALRQRRCPNCGATFG